MAAAAFGLAASSLWSCADKSPAPEPAEQRSYAPDPEGAPHYSAIQRRFALDGAERELWKHNGFVISTRHYYPTFSHGYKDIYERDLPVYVSADGLLHAVHRSYDHILTEVELHLFSRELEWLLDRMRARLKAGAARSMGVQAERDVDEYLAVADALLRDRAAIPVRGGDSRRANDFVKAAKAAEGVKEQRLFGVARELDFSQFKPRGHYAEDPDLQKYFRAMIWLGRVEMRIIGVDATSRGVSLNRRALDASLAVRALLDQPAFERWNDFDRAVALFVGPQDNLTVVALDGLIRELGASSPLAARKVTDADWHAALARPSNGARIASADQPAGTLEVSFALLGQRAVLDSEVLSKVTYDRVRVDGKPRRFMPDPLDVAYAALGNADALAPLQGGIDRYGYGPKLDEARAFVDQQGETFWGSSLYNLWLRSLRTLSPRESEEAIGLPSVFRTRAWGRRILNTQLASWAELRHDTLLYAKQSYARNACEFPDAYVDPYPEFYASLKRYADTGRLLADFARMRIKFYSDDAQMLIDLAARIRQHFENLGTVANMLEAMAARERKGEPLDAGQLAFINQMVQVKGFLGCDASAPALAGWYENLFFELENTGDPIPYHLNYDPIIADVHTQMTDDAGQMVGNILHVGTGRPRLMAVTVDTVAGPANYVGLVSSYYEETTSGFNRLTDKEWSRLVVNRKSPEWLVPAVVSSSRSTSASIGPDHRTKVRVW